MSSWIEITALLGIVAAAAYWLDAMRAKELAREAGRRACDEAGAQFLDDTVVLRRVRPVRLTTGSLALLRNYDFEFSVNGAVRQHGEVAIHGRQQVRLALDLPNQPNQTERKHIRLI